jgi:hypothetical protein
MFKNLFKKSMSDINKIISTQTYFKDIVKIDFYDNDVAVSLTDNGFKTLNDMSEQVLLSFYDGIVETLEALLFDDALKNDKEFILLAFFTLSRSVISCLKLHDYAKKEDEKRKLVIKEMRGCEI